MCFFIEVLCFFRHGTSLFHLLKKRRILSYIKQTKYFGVLYEKSLNLLIISALYGSMNTSDAIIRPITVLCTLKKEN